MKAELDSSDQGMGSSPKAPTNFIGSMVSIDCGLLGTYQGLVQKIDPVMNTLTITHAFLNGLKCDQPELNLSSTTIRDIKIIHASHEASEIISRKATPSKMTKEIDEVTKPTCTSPIKIIKATSKARTGFPTSSASGSIKETENVPVSTVYVKGSCRRKLSPPDSPSKYLDSAHSHRRQRASNSVSKEFSVTEGHEQGNGHDLHNSKHSSSKSELQTQSPGRKMSQPKRMERGGKRTTVNSKNSECFSAPTQSYLQDFDFESNLALFNKKAVFQEIENEFPELSLSSGPPLEQKYRHDENILQPGESNMVPVRKQQIKVPGTTKKLYITDSGLLVPAISQELREQLCALASEHGLSHSRQLESFCRSASDMAIHLIGGSHRIHPKNDHQMPAVVVLCGAHDHGALGACCARILSSHGVQVTLVTPNCPLPTITTQEIELFKLTGNTVVHNVKGLPKTVDLVVSALDSPFASTFNQQPWYQNVVAWTKSQDVKAQILALDPPPQGPGMSTRWSLFKVLPLAETSPHCGSLYLCDLSIPSAIFAKLGITYVSPFGSKFVISLHEQD
ncbi:enhancer of mRNA-decapping protein 3 [Elysia marginata]|uniref:Enhancer of mRNA-decapping protein 3 n=1 Tax=Elysia marginata TaxID=1093978 RepID=A0AAV4F8F7_9GAST|nr:enhancer of mRNA-decapping protein 3 [Elysia marginata]